MKSRNKKKKHRENIKYLKGDELQKYWNDILAKEGKSVKKNGG